MKQIARIIHRGDRIGGLFIPLCNDFPEGIYEVVEIMGELILKRLSGLNMPDRCIGISIKELFDERCFFALTEKELKDLNKYENDKI